MTDREIRKALREKHFDRITHKKDGSWYVDRSYFYRMGMTPEELEAKVMDALPSATMVRCGDKWRAWPQRSCMWVTFEVSVKKTFSYRKPLTKTFSPNEIEVV